MPVTHTQHTAQSSMRFFAGLVIGLAFLFFMAPAAHATGVTPAIFEYDNLANGVEITDTVYVTRVKGDSEQVFDVSLVGDSAHQIQLTEPTLTMNVGEVFKGYSFTIAPTSAPNGSHKVSIKFVGRPGTQKTGGAQSAAVATGAQAHIFFGIVDHEVAKMSVSGFTIDPTEINIAPVLSFLITNSGNVDVRPDYIEATFTDLSDPSHIIKGRIEGTTLPFLRPGQEQPLSARFPEALPLGRYAVTASVVFHGEEIYRSIERVLNVYPPGTLAQEAQFNAFSVTPSTAVPGSLIKISGEVKNVGQIPVDSIFVVEVYRGDTLVDILRSEPKIISVAGNSQYVHTFRPDKNGEYKFDAVFEYGAKETERKSATVSVKTQSLFTTLAIYGGIGLMMIIVALIITHYLRKRSHGKTLKKKDVHNKKSHEKNEPKTKSKVKPGKPRAKTKRKGKKKS
ncbi:MAG: hypothetical protein COU35_05155 [Candidatus Magasanikbacteria bacterium CG10_big_fil_rev_8_21_14_0_10_47_10]|uniref:CARDB domain-containing protein n=1 Tax=Candidatus Magasanikbacteria bacterium CG10_big_fil_rev_8_21_14_0_10_47_10 TaxID=1974652 RepID=A0A2H0TP47_9BACT|nr:MAG: hypothetical protein COU35_05155 [Candidatus Magasanikbacteria bacterium CG10_big_fil_rev_8_21_14_0_10_47_10]